MMNSGRSLSKSKIEGLKDSMNSAIHGVRRIAHEFNIDMQWLGRTIRIGKSRVHDILTSAGIYEKEEIIKNFCNDKNIILHIIPKASPWIQAFIERGFRTLKQEFLNLVWIGNWDKFKDVLIDSRFEYNNRPHSSFGYRSPFETRNDAIMNLPQHVCGH